ncbi:MAG: hypothetical protein JJ975_07895 [Bacteroidia bacterium]|nr:hypothetical protein [Bacteroidia bacterium]
MRTAGLLLFITFFSACASNPGSIVNADRADVERSGGKTYVGEIPFTGQLVRLSENGDSISIESFKQGGLEGVSKHWYPNGQLKEHRYYRDNRKHGFHQGWYANGQQAFQYWFDDGVYTDTIREWYGNGQLYQVSVYRNGRQEGRQQAWRENGELYLNYDVRNGRKYGNSGIKHCKSLWSEVVDNM